MNIDCKKKKTMTKILIEKKLISKDTHTHTHHIIICSIHSLEVHVDVLIHVVHPLTDEFDYPLLTSIHVMIELLPVVLKMLDDTKK